MITISPALAALAAIPQWICYRAVPSTTRPGKIDKVPTDPRTGYLIDAQDPASWMPSAAACDMADASGLGVGVVLTADDPYFCVDLDDAASGGAWLPHVDEVLSLLPGAAVERSISGRGLHIFGRYAGLLPHSTRAPAIHAELYSLARFIAIGDAAVGDASTDCSAGYAQIIARWFAPPVAADAGAGWTHGPRPEYTGPTDDGDLVARACRSQSASAAFGGAASFAALWHADVVALSRAYPDPARGYDASRADAALARHLAFWAGGDCDRIEQLMRRSALAREKWDTHSSYLTRTITGACSQTTRVYDRGAAPVVPTPTAAESRVPGSRRTGYQYLPADAQLDHFRGCTYIRPLDRVLTPDGALLRSSQFRPVYGGYVFALDDGQPGKTTRNAWEAFLESQVHDAPIATGVVFDPRTPWDALIEREGERLANTYRPIPTARAPGDPTPFTDHVHRLLPVGDDAEILLSYLAAVVQYPGRKFTWCPLIQGTPGNGKSLITNCVRRAIGTRHTYDARASRLVSQFNGWLSGRVFVVIDDLRADAETLEILKPMITASEGIEIERKGADQTTEPICCNFVITSNHRDAITKTADDRRFAVMFCAQQSAADLQRDGLDEPYFAGLLAWLDAGGYAIVHDYLATRPIADARNPARACLRAPATSSLAAAIAASISPAAQEIDEAAHSDQIGFRGGWISGTYLDGLLRERSIRLSRHARAELLTTMGYVRHPALGEDGRTTQPVMPDGRRAVLWVHRDRRDLLILSGPAAVLRYASDQDTSFPVAGMRAV